MILNPTDYSQEDFNEWLAQCPVQWFKLDEQSYQFLIDTSEEEEEEN